MQKTILQVPLNKTLKLNAESAALEQGFSSLQEIVRVFLAKLAEKKIEVGIDTVFLSKKNEKRYIKMTKDFESNKNVKTAKNIDEFFAQLNED